MGGAGKTAIAERFLSALPNVMPAATEKGKGTICRNGPKRALHKWFLCPFSHPIPHFPSRTACLCIRFTKFALKKQIEEAEQKIWELG